MAFYLHFHQDGACVGTLGPFPREADANAEAEVWVERLADGSVIELHDKKTGCGPQKREASVGRRAAQAYARGSIAANKRALALADKAERTIGKGLVAVPGVGLVAKATLPAIQRVTSASRQHLASEGERALRWATGLVKDNPRRRRRRKLTDAERREIEEHHAKWEALKTRRFKAALAALKKKPLTGGQLTTVLGKRKVLLASHHRGSPAYRPDGWTLARRLYEDGLVEIVGYRAGYPIYSAVRGHGYPQRGNPPLVVDAWFVMDEYPNEPFHYRELVGDLSPDELAEIRAMRIGDSLWFGRNMLTRVPAPGSRRIPRR